MITITHRPSSAQGLDEHLAKSDRPATQPHRLIVPGRPWERKHATRRAGAISLYDAPGAPASDARMRPAT